MDIPLSLSTNYKCETFLLDANRILNLNISTIVLQGSSLILDVRINDKKFKCMKTENNCVKSCKMKKSKDKNKFTKER